MNFFSRRNQILLRELIKTDFKLRYQGSVIGYLWSILKPLMLFLVMYVVFMRFLKFGNDVPHFAVALLLGMTIWNFFSEVTNVGMLSIVSRGDLLRKINFSKDIIVFSVAANAAINFVITLLVVVIFAVANGIHFSWNIIFVIPLIAEIALFSIGVALILATIFVKFRDIGPIWEVAMQAGLYATPIIYPVTLLVKNANMLVAKIVLMNPIAQVIQDMRYILTYSNNTNPTVWQIVHNPLLVMIPYILPIIIFIIGWYVFNKNSMKFAEIV